LAAKAAEKGSSRKRVNLAFATTTSSSGGGGSGSGGSGRGSSSSDSRRVAVELMLLLTTCEYSPLCYYCEVSNAAQPAKDANGHLVQRCLFKNMRKHAP
jgi:hypothetical protein